MVEKRKTSNSKKKLILHLGTEKTGSKAIQTAAMHNNGDKLFYPTSGRGAAFWHKDIFISEKPCALKTAIDEIPNSSVGLISYERAYMCSDERINDFANLDVDISSFILVRDPLPWLHSFRNQAIKSWSTTIQDIVNVFDDVQFCVNAYKFSESCPKWQSVCNELLLATYKPSMNVIDWFETTYYKRDKVFSRVPKRNINLALNSEGIKVFVRLKTMQFAPKVQIEICRALQKNYSAILFEKQNKFRFYTKQEAEKVGELLSGEAEYVLQNFGLEMNLRGRGGDYWSLERLLNDELSKEANDALQHAIDEGENTVANLES